MSRSITLHCEIDDDLRSQIDLAQRTANSALAAAPTGYAAFLRRRGRYLSGRSSTVIEGNPLDEAASLLATFDGHGDSAAHIDMRNSVEACSLALDWAEDPSFRPDQGAIRAFNSVLLRGLPGQAAEHRGRYRLGGSMVINAATRRIVYTTPPPGWVPELMASLQSTIGHWLSSDPPEFAAAKAHFGLVSVHPFEDGNGRTARLLADAILHQAGANAQGMASLSTVILNRRAEYYETLAAVQGPEFQGVVDVSRFVRFHTAALLETVTGLQRYVAGLNLRRENLREVNTELNERQILGVLAVREFSPLSASSYAELTECSPQTARADLATLAGAGLVGRIGRGKATRYELAEPTRALLSRV